MLETVPAFLAVNFEVGVGRKLAAIQKSLQTAPSMPASKISWVSPANFNIVLRHLGRIDPALAPGILDPLRLLAAGLPTIRVQLGPLRAFPSPDRARLIVVQAMDPAGLLLELAAKIEQLLSELGIPPAIHPLHPHVTLARLDEPTMVEAWISAIDALSIETRLTDVAAYQHTQRRPGTEHTVLDRFALAPPPRPSLRPSRAPKQTSQRPSKRPKADASTSRADAIPAPPRLPSIPLSCPQPVAAASNNPDGTQPSEESAASSAAQPEGSGPSRGETRSNSSILPPSVQAALPPDDEWGS
jgi:2'-5' RNA ligase